MSTAQSTSHNVDGRINDKDFSRPRRIVGKRALATLAAATASWMLAPHYALGATAVTWIAPTGAGLEEWENNSNWTGGTYPDANTYVADFAGTTANSTVDLGQNDTVAEISGDYSAVLGQMQSYTFQDQPLSIDLNRSSSAGFAIDCENGTGTAMTFNNNVQIENTNINGNPSQVVITEEFGPASGAGTLNLNGQLMLSSLGAPTVLAPQDGGSININGTIDQTGASGTNTYFGIEASSGASGGTVNLDETNGTTADGVYQLIIGGSATQSNTVNLGTSLTLESGSGSTWIDETVFLGYVAGNNQLYLNGNGVTLTTANIRFGASATATDTLTVGSNYSGGTTTNTIVAPTFSLPTTVGDAQTFVVYAAANNTLNMGTINFTGGESTEKVVLSGAGTVEIAGKSTTAVPMSFAAAGGVLEVAGAYVTSANVLTKGPTGTGTFNITNGTIEDNGAQEAVPETVTVGGSATFQDLPGSPVTGTGLIFGALAAEPLLTLSSFSLTASSTFTVNNTTAIQDTISDGGHNYSLNLNGAGTLSLAGSNSYGGGTNISAATLQVANANALGTGPVVVNSPGILDLNGNSPTIVSLSGSGTVDNVSAVGTPTLTINTTTSSTFSGNIQNTTGSTALAVSGTGTQTLTGTNTYNGGTTVTSGTLVVNNPVLVGPLPNQVLTNEAMANGPVSIVNGTLQLAQSTGLATITGLTISGTGTFDVYNNHVIINYGSPANDPIASIASLLATGYNGGLWNGAGGIVSTAAAATSASYGLGYADSADQGNPAGLASGTIEIAYTLLGDANLDGVVNGTDFGILAANFNKGVTNWDQGDFNYGPAVNATDFGELAANFNKGATGASIGEPAYEDPAILAFAAANGLLADVPEPASMGMLAVGAIGLMARRRRQAQL